MASADVGRNLTERDEETSSTKMACTILESNDSPPPPPLSLSLSHGTAEKNRPLHTKHEEKTMHCAEGDGRWHQDKIEPIARAQSVSIMSWTLSTLRNQLIFLCACDKMTKSS